MPITTEHKNIGAEQERNDEDADQNEGILLEENREDVTTRELNGSNPPRREEPKEQRKESEENERKNKQHKKKSEDKEGEKRNNEFELLEEKTEGVKAKNASEAFDALLSSVGTGGRWQLRAAIIVTLMGIPTAFHNLGAIFLGATPEYRCDNPYLPDPASVEPHFYQQIVNFTTPWTMGKEGENELSQCFYYNRDPELNQTMELITMGANDTSMSPQDIYYPMNDRHPITVIPPVEKWRTDPEQIPCSRWIYNTSTFTSTAVTEWNLVCDRAWLKPTVQSTYMMGLLTGAVSASAFSDKFGRRPALLASSFIFFVAGVLTAFSTSLEMFLVLRFIVGGAGQGVTLIKFVIIMETTGQLTRDFYGNINSIGWSIGTFFLGVLGYFLRDWWSLQLTLSVPMVLLLLMYWFLPESPRWLLMQGRSKEGVAILEQIGKVNGGKKLPKKEDLDFYLAVIQKDVRVKKKSTGSCFHGFTRIFYSAYLLVKTPNMRRRSLIMFYSWFVVSMCFYGASFSGENIGVSVHTLTIISSFFSLPGIFVTYYSAIKLGRRVTLCYTMILSGVCLIAILFVPTSMGYLNMALTILGRTFLEIVFYSVFFYSNELVPTNIRNLAMGIASGWARIGSAIGPFIVDLGGAVYYALPSTVFGILTIVAGLLALLLPETNRQPFAETIHEIEAMPR